ncbi:hypothetical protein G6F50_018477 [Rhizopus delemar]|uniref:Uncharacterized protein n=1 Tax=Rhizopus delemar TaxID=936053 RepID=A0A9P6XMP7_9FUNG|nr:hypothetical protein G6F50_018477 [Rhizopus delemar]
MTAYAGHSPRKTVPAATTHPRRNMQPSSSTQLAPIQQSSSIRIPPLLGMKRCSMMVRSLRRYSWFVGAKVVLAAIKVPRPMLTPWPE